MNTVRPKSLWMEKVDNAVAKFTRDILGVANKAKIDFAYGGTAGDRKTEIERTMKINDKAVTDLLRLG